MTLLTLNVFAFGGKFLNPWSWKDKILFWPLDLGNMEGEKLLSSYKRDPRIVCKTCWRKAFPRVIILARCFVERDGAVIFLKWVRIPRRQNNFSRGNESQGAQHISQDIYCFCTVLYLLGTFFKEGSIMYGLLGTLFEGRTMYRLLGMIFKVYGAWK